MCGADVFAIDIDSGLALEEAEKRLFSNQIEALLGTSKSHQKEKNGVVADRFRIIFPLRNPLILPSQVRPLFDAILKLFPEADPACKDAARFYYPCTEVIVMSRGKMIDEICIPEPVTTTEVTRMLTHNETEALPLSVRTERFIKEGAPEGSRNKPFIAAVHDAIQQNWTQEGYIAKLQRDGLSWMTEPQNLLKIAERYQNFKPQHAPRLAMRGQPETKSQRLPLNQVRQVLLRWLEEHDVAVSYNRSLYIGRDIVSSSDVIRKITIGLADMNYGLDAALLDCFLQEWIQEKRMIHLEAVRASLTTFNPEEGDKELRKFLGVLKRDFTDLDVQTLKHMMWQVKRKLNGQKTKFEMMCVFTGGQGAGKSTALRDTFFIPLGDLAYTGADFSVLSDQRESRLFSDHYIIMFDEMSGAAKSDMERTKQIITSHILKQRRMGTTSHDYLPMNATFFGTANPELDTLIRDSTGMRRFYEIKVDKRVFTEKRWPILKTIDAALMWAAVDGSAEESPIDQCAEELRNKQEDLRDKNPIEWMLDEGMLALTDKEEEFSPAILLSYAVSVVCGQTWSTKRLAKEWDKFGIKKRKTATSNAYGVKITDNATIRTIEAKYRVIIGSGGSQF